MSATTTKVCVLGGGNMGRAVATVLRMAGNEIAVWVREDRKTEAEMLGYTVVDVVSVLVTHLTETIRRHAHEIITREDVQTLMDRVKESAPTVVGELVPDVMPLGDVQRVLQNLLSERVQKAEVASSAPARKKRPWWKARKRR